jgi:hypothetical protein
MKDIRTGEIKSRISTEKVAFNRKKTIFTSRFGLNLGMKLVKYHTFRNVSVALRCLA